MPKVSRVLGYGLLLYLLVTLGIWKTWNSLRMCGTIETEEPFVKTAIQTTEDNIATFTTTNSEHKVHKCKPYRKKIVDCRLLFRGDPDYIQLTKSMKEEKQMPEECTLEKLVKNCSMLRQSHGYENKHASKEELEFPLAFTIKMHTAPYQMERLLRAIYMPHNFYCIHIDAKTDNKTYDLVKALADCLTNVVVLETRINVVYASSRHVKSELQCMKRCNQSKVKWKYYINLTGQEFPLRTNLELVEILKLFKGANDIEAYKHPKSLNWRLSKRIKIIKEKLVKTSEVKNSLPYKIQIYKGSAYGMFSKEFVDFMLNDNIAHEIFDWMNDTYSPEENIWSTLNSLSFAPGGYNSFETRHDTFTHASKAVIWAWDKVKCQGRLIRSVCVYGLEDLPWLQNRPEIVANKFYEDIDSVVLDCLEESLRNRTNFPELEHLNWHYYRNLPQVKHYWKLKDSEKTKEFLEQKKLKWLTEQMNYKKSLTSKNSSLNNTKKNFKNAFVNNATKNIAIKTKKTISANNTIITNKVEHPNGNENANKSNKEDKIPKNTDKNKLGKNKENNKNTSNIDKSNANKTNPDKLFIKKENITQISQ